jgi:hypothetical protein
MWAAADFARCYPNPLGSKVAIGGETIHAPPCVSPSGFSIEKLQGGRENGLSADGSPKGRTVQFELDSEVG